MAAQTSNAKPPLYGLVLAGGKSSRMGRDKAEIAYHGKPQLAVAVEQAREFCEMVFVSVRGDEPPNSGRAAYPQIADRFGHIGPIDGIRSALAAHPDHAWLVLACDLPRLDRETLAHLVQRRNPARAATAYASSTDGLPEPLCAIYEPRIAEHLASFKCPRKALIRADLERLALKNARALDNANTPEDIEPLMKKRIEVLYFAALRERRGASREQVETAARDAAGLYEELQLGLPRQSLRVAINDQFAAWETALKSGDSVMFIPPTAGG